MTVFKAAYDGLDGADLHLVPGMDSPQLNQLLFLLVSGSQPGTTTVVRGDALPPDVTLTFSTNLDGPPFGHGLELDETTGRMTMVLPDPAPGLRSFIVTAKIVDRATFTFQVRKRIHVHAEIQRLWLAPNPLTVRAFAHGIRPTVLARFGDGVIGDVSNWGATDSLQAPSDNTFARVTDTHAPWLTWSVDGPLTVDPDTGVLTTGFEDPQGSVSVQAGPNRSPATTATAAVVGGLGWQTPVPLTAIGPHTDAKDLDRRTNVLILPDGFVDGEQKQFEKLAGDLVGMLAVDAHTSPYNLIIKRMNFFIAWVPSRQPGVTVLNEVLYDPQAGEGLEKPFPQPKTKPAPGSTIWSLPRLLAEVGPPAPFLDAPGSKLGTLTEGRLFNWRQRFGTRIDPANLDQELVDLWLALGDRVLVDDVDSAFHTAFNTRPTVSNPVRDNFVGFNRRRGTRADFDTFLNAVTFPGATMSGRWATGGPDAAHVVILCRSRRAGGANTPQSGNARSLAMALDAKDRHRLAPASSSPGVAVARQPVPARASNWAWLTLAHELTHSWEVRDEYGGGLSPNDPGVIREVDAAGNVQGRPALLVRDPTTGQSTLSSAALRWRWLRITGCGVLASDPVPLGADGQPTTHVGDAVAYRLQLRKGHLQGPDRSRVRPFAAGDIVRLRPRPLVGSIPSDQLRVRQVDPARDRLIVEGFTGHPLSDLTGFTAAGGQETIVIRPRHGHDPTTRTGAEEELVAHAIAEHIDKTHNPLNAADNAGHDRDWAKEGIDAVAPTGAPHYAAPSTRPHGPRLSSSLVGLFEEGGGTIKDVYRPTGICLMRRGFARKIVNGEESQDKNLAYPFCPVCRYVIVDRIDPAQHGLIDLDYEPEYFRP